MDKKSKSILQYVLWAAVSVLLLYFSFRNISWKDFWDALHACRWEWVFFSMFLGLVVLYLRGLRWQMLLRPIDPGTRVSTCFNAMNICMLVNLAVTRLGEVVRCGYVTKHSARDSEGRKLASFDKVIGTVVIDRLWDAVSIVVVMGVIMVVMWDRVVQMFSGNSDLTDGMQSQIRLLWILLGAVAAGAVFIWLCWRLRDKGRIWGRVWGFLSGIGDGLKSCLHMEHGWLFIFYTLLMWICYWLMSAAIIWALSDIDTSVLSPELAASLGKVRELGLGDAFFLMFVGAVSTVVPVPGGFGAFHSIVAGTIASVYGIPFSVGLIFATLSHESQVVTDAVAGLSSYAYESFRKGDA